MACDVFDVLSYILCIRHLIRSETFIVNLNGSTISKLLY